jgi:hypothetical protein
VSTSQTFRKFRLSPFGSQHGVSCDEHGAFVSGVPLLARTAGNDGHGEWKPRDIRELSADLSKRLGLPIDVSSKSKGIAALAEAFNNNADIARAQLNALHLQFPNSQPLPGSHGFSRENFVGFVRALDASGLIKADWNPDEHPRWPAGVPDSQGGQFAPKGEGGATAKLQSQMASWIATAFRWTSTRALLIASVAPRLRNLSHLPQLQPSITAMSMISCWRKSLTRAIFTTIWSKLMPNISERLDLKLKQSFQYRWQMEAHILGLMCLQEWQV